MTGEQQRVGSGDLSEDPEIAVYPSRAVKSDYYRISRSDIGNRADRMEAVLNKVKEAALRPESVKSPPRFNMTNTADILGLTKSQMLHRFATGKFKPGEKTPSNRTMFSIPEVREMARSAGLRHKFAEGHGIVLCVANFKGGVLKTTTTVTLAQYLSLRGLNVLVIDLDPQASCTTLFGISPLLQVDLVQSSYGLYTGGENADPLASTRATYWPGIDLVATNQYLYKREFGLAASAREFGGEIFGYLAEQLPELRAKYDVILIDTQPNLGFLTSTAIFASDHLVVTVPTSSLDFASSVVFWSLLRDMMSTAEAAGGMPKFWDSVRVLMTRVDITDKSAQFNKGLLQMGCEGWLYEHHIPATRVATNASAEFQTLYDLEKYEGSHKSLKKAREAYDLCFGAIHASLNDTWDFRQSPESYNITQAPDSADLFTQSPAEGSSVPLEAGV
jgi:chromosome partitioning protein